MRLYRVSCSQCNKIIFRDKRRINEAKKFGWKTYCSSEKIIDDWLYAREIKHKTNVPYASNDGFTADFKIGDYWIEFFGLSGQHQRYDELKEEKLKLVKKHNLKLLELYPKHLFSKGRLGEVLNVLLN